MVSELLMDAAQTERFESACTAAGARFIGGLFACLALVEHEFTGALTYYGLTPRDTRRTTDNFMTQGWFTGLVPITVPIAAASFGDAAWAAQASFDSGLDLAKVPYYRVLELAPWLSWPQPNFPVSNFLHGGAAPLNAVLAAADLGYANNIGIYSDGRYSYQLTIYVFPVRRGHGDGDHVSRQSRRPEISCPLHGGDEVRLRAGRRQRALGTRCVAGFDGSWCGVARCSGVGECRRRAHATAPSGGEGDMRRLADFVVRWPWVVIGSGSRSRSPYR